MLLTEKEAREKWCPEARVQEDGTGNRYPFDTDSAEGFAFARCLASDCMMWRWEDDESYSSRFEDWAADNQPIEQGGPGPSGSKPPKSMGYCGKAGKP